MRLGHARGPADQHQHRSSAAHGQLVERYGETQRFRLQMRPGLTGPMQVHGRGELNFQERLAGLTVESAQRRGKFLWLPLREHTGSKPSQALLVHLGMSGQLLVAPADQPQPRHERIRLALSPAHDDAGAALPEQARFVGTGLVVSARAATVWVGALVRVTGV